jgi:hypothetical protein
VRGYSATDALKRRGREDLANMFSRPHACK